MALGSLVFTPDVVSQHWFGISLIMQVLFSSYFFLTYGSKSQVNIFAVSTVLLFLLKFPVEYSFVICELAMSFLVLGLSLMPINKQPKNNNSK
jgi:predicted membrane protein